MTKKGVATSLLRNPLILAALMIVAATLHPFAAIAADDPDALLTTPVTPEILATGSEDDAYVQGVQAYVWGYPLVRMERVARQYTDVPANNPATSYRAPLNRIGGRAISRRPPQKTCRRRTTIRST